MGLKEVGDSFEAAKELLLESGDGVNRIQELNTKLVEQLGAVETGINGLPFNFLNEALYGMVGIANDKVIEVDYAQTELQRALSDIETPSGTRARQAIDETSMLLRRGTEEVSGVERLCISVLEDVEGMRGHIASILELVESSRQKASKIEQVGLMITGKKGSKLRGSEPVLGTIPVAIEAIREAKKGH